MFLLLVTTMAFNPSRYETVYGVSLFDDVHNFLPELLYDSGLFQSPITMLLHTRLETLFPEEYIRNRTFYRLYQQTRRRRNAGFLIPSRQIYEPQASQSLPQTPPLRPTADMHAEMEFILHPPPSPSSPASPSSPPPIIRTSRTHRIQPVEAQTQNQSAVFSLLATLFPSLNLDQVTTQYTSEFMEPVSVRPTSQQIQTATLLTSVEPAADVVCSICQDHTSPTPNETEWRYIRHCSHGFHRSCIDQWFQQNVRCPVCRYDIREHTQENHSE